MQGGVATGRSLKCRTHAGAKQPRIGVAGPLAAAFARGVAWNMVGGCTEYAGTKLLDP